MAMYFFQDASFPDLCKRALSGPAILFTGLLLPNVFFFSWTTRYTTFVAIVACSIAAFREHQISSQIVSYLLGFSIVWTVILSADLILFKNPRKEFKRVQRIQDGGDGTPQYEWESFPESLSIKRVFWVLDLICNPRGNGWNFRKKLHCPPKEVLRLYEGRENALNTTEKVEMNSSHSAASPKANTDIAPIGRVKFLINHMGFFILDWVLVELATHGMTLDPFLNGSGDLNPFVLPLPYALFWIRLLPYRMVVAGIGCYSIIDLFFVTVSLIGVGLGERLLGTWGETWMYPRHWGSILDVCYQGLAGFWGTFWHDLLKNGFLTFVHGLVPSSTSPNPVPSNRTRRFLRMNLIFALSGVMHMAGSYIQTERTIPILTFLAFYLQAVGISLQGWLMGLLEGLKVKKETSKVIIVFCFSAVWGFMTLPLLLKDMAAGGLFRTKFLPFSITGLWFGNKWPGWFES